MNQFEQLCKLASSENWCWKLSCSTCGHMHFRYAFAELANGKSPTDPDWPIHSENSEFRTLGQYPYRFSKAQIQAILKICHDADLLAIAQKCRFPDWLGYLGLILNHSEGNSDYQQLSATWSAQLADVVTSETPIHATLLNIANGKGELSIADLEMIEQNIDIRFRFKSMRDF